MPKMLTDPEEQGRIRDSYLMGDPRDFTHMDEEELEERAIRRVLQNKSSINHAR